ncbi:RNA polymerase sigma factor [Pseudonocardia sp. CA-107938]|uniref:RNA polymerase sigma factor n=1 Tax=Pseudonocardia sp. CA-107938 TaxID=3240021 RepID=UPI003D8EC678
MIDTVDDDLDDLSAFPDIGAALRGAAALGEGVVLGLVPRGRAGIRRVSRAQVDEFERRFAQAYRDRLPMLVRYAARKVGDHSRAEDVVQRAFEKILRRHRQDLPEITNLSAYLLTTVCNEINRELRTVIPERQNLTSIDGGAEDDERSRAELPDDRPDISHQVADAMALKAALATLSPRERECVVMRVQWQMSVAEAAEALQLSTGSVKRYTFDGLKRLREQLAAA